MKKWFFWHMKKIRETNIFVTNNFLLRNQNDNVNSNFVKLDKANLIFYSFYSGIWQSISELLLWNITG